MTATEELRRLLDERGAEWTNPNSILRDDMTSWVANGFDYDAFEVPDGTLVLSAAHQDDLTPAQAIAATLGRGMLTADDVRDLIERHSDASGGNGRDFHNGAYVAIADELNATLGSGTCHVESSIIDTYEYNRWEYELSCGHTIIWEDSEPPRFCPDCGRRVV